MKKCRKFRVPERKYLEVYKNLYFQEAVWGVVKNGWTHCSIGIENIYSYRSRVYVGFHMPPDLCAAWINLGAPRSGGQVDDIWVAPR